MRATYIIFIISLFILFYNYVGYGLLLWVMVRIKRMLVRTAPAPAPPYEPDVTLVVAAYNEEGIITAKIENTLALDYPAHKRRLLFITDGSTDATPQIISRYPELQLLHTDKRGGKTAALNRAMEQVQTPYVIFCDANTLLNKDAIRNIVKHYADETVGGVAGEKKVISDDSSGAAATEGIYWKYESYLKKLDAELYSVVGAAGELFSIRTGLFQPVEEEVILDDFVISLRINLKGYRIAYAPDAYAMETPSDNIAEEHKRKIRISAGGFQSIVMLRALLNFFRFPVVSFQYISHRVLRWTLSPLSLLLLLVTNIMLVIYPGGWLFYAFLLIQVMGYAAAFIGYSLAERNIKISIFYIPFYFLFMNIAVYQGFYRYLTNTQSAAWEKAKRSKI
ncbi:Glycosyltransferase, catalytic subunit of cellulose synthase and poly-beta-1,6-N-acetylglucosamine synthase [Chitinophaga rupis]|uniref:Glycosyltransferase, catalytic subunit of cellulose synthase and poly-beta-1,6-N-acetylglucosamine synthase n=1 Tax=Chitinophaga rupis TaxID=573321 RepID=A0A1H8K6X7_9BACT|nr:glycosyltransferase family 2 protein [Chitinophaga rupis]SEN88158.1 Glycosyltransferase, catalytic subunit of cellulose synthase and poly-beta-1,6-N-acetylglucosamine synthase [Chitinophaga rupis]